MTLGLRSLGVSTVVFGAALWGCKVDPGTNSGFTEPCHELQGDLTCESFYTNRPYCSLCTTDNQGCVMTPPATVCQPDAGSTGEPMRPPDTDSSSGSSSSGAVDTTLALDSSGDSTTGEPPCAAEGELDPECAALDPERPFCVDAACVGCEGAGGDEFCSGLDPLAPACDLEGGSCLACGDVQHAVCNGATPVCDASGGCVVCTAHEQCPESACHLGPDDPLLGRCFEPDEVLWVNNGAPCPGSGTEEDPACDLQDTTDALMPGDNRVIRLIGGGFPYADRAVFTQDVTVALIGEWDPELVGDPQQQAASLFLSDDVTIYVQGIHLLNNALTHGVLCNSSYLRIEDSTMRDNAGWGMYSFQPCDVDIRRTIISNNEDGGMRLAGGSLWMDNTTVGLNGIGGNSTGLRVQDADMHVLYSTIAGNDGSSFDSIQCDNVTGTLRNNIIVGIDGTSMDLGCFPLLMDHNAMDASNFASGTNVEVVPYDEIFFNNPPAGDFTLSAPPLTPFGDVALWMQGDPDLDADGTPRPTDGSLGFAGIDEP